MESNGYITKSRELSDERIVKIRLTSKGWEMREKAATIPDSMKNCISLSPEKAGQLYTLLYELLDDIKEHQIEHV
jgi:DNA-binding MarR family transcriptional regulator